MKVICIDDSNRPNDVPNTRWVKKGQEYTIRAVCWLTIQQTYGVRIEEINNDDLFPYSYFAMSRFAVTKVEIATAVEEEDLELEPA